MRHPLSLAAILLAIFFAGPAVASRAQAGPAADGKILRVEGKPQIKQKGSATWRALRSPDDIWLPLREGDQVQCPGDKDVVEILIPDGKMPITKSHGPYTIQPTPKPQHREIADVIVKFGVSGATRGSGAQTRIFWPAEGSVVLPEHFAVRWAPVSQKISISILSETKDVTLWGPTEVDGSTGSLQSRAISSALAAYKAKSANPALILTVTFGNPSDWDEVRFSLLTARQQQELNSELDFWSKNADGLALHIGRGYFLLRHKLYAEAADEYELALESAPDSPYLLTDVIDADRLAGRLPRVKELQSRLAAQPRAGNQ